MMRLNRNQSLAWTFGLLAAGCGDHDRYVGKQSSDGSGGQSEPGTHESKGGDDGSGGSSYAKSGGTSGTSKGGATGENTTTQGGSTGGTSGLASLPTGGSIGTGGSSGFGGVTNDPCATVACVRHSQCALNASNSPECVCDSGYELRGGQCVSLQPITDVDMGDSHVCAVRADGTVACWGQNLDYALGTGTLESNTHSDVPLQILNISRAIAIDANEHATCALESDHTVKCWGFVAGKTSKTPAIVDGLSDARTISASAGTACAVVGSGHAYCWGVIGSVWSPTPVLVSGTVGPVVRAIYADSGVVCSILNDDSVHCIPESQEQIEDVPILENAARFGTDKGNQSAPLVVMQDGTVRSPDKPKTYPYDYLEVDGYAGVISAAGGGGFMCGVHSSGDVTCSGANSEGVLCDGTMESHAVPAPAIGLTNAVKVSVGFSQGCALDRSGDLRCWGRAVNGELGDGTRPGRSIPYEVPNITNTAGICVGGDSTCALNAVAELRCWGRNHSSGNPVPWLSDVVQCSGGGNFCSVMKDGTVKCWGNSPVGDGTATPRSNPTTVLGLTDATFVVSGEHSCAVRRDGMVACWGQNGYGELGDGTKTDRLSPVTVVGLSNAIRVAVGSNHSCALLRDGTVRCWGKNDSGQLGNGTVSQVDGLIAPLGLPSIRQLSTGPSKTYAVSENGEVFTWGGILSIKYPTNENESPITTYDHTPHLWSGPTGVAEVVQGRYVRLLNGQVMTNKDNGWVFARGFGETKAIASSGHVCSVLTNGKVRCAGDGTFGQLGDGYTTGRPWPEMIAAW